MVRSRPMRTAPRIGSGLAGWRRLVVVAALANAVVLFGYGLTRGDREALGFAVVMLVGVGLLRVGTGLVGLLVLAALFVNIELWMFPAANGNATYRAGLVDLLVPASLVAFSLAGFIGAVAAIVHLRDPGAGRGAAGPTGILAVVFIFTSFGLVWAMTDAERQVVPEGAIEVETINVAFVPDTLRAGGGKVTVAVRNRDLFWHTFTIDRLGVDVRAPVGGLRSATFEAEPGTYSYYCRIPGHETLGMRGTITVR
jgi:plastocyanin